MKKADEMKKNVRNIIKILKTYSIDENINDACCLTNCLLMPEYNLQKYTMKKLNVCFYSFIS